MESSSTRDAQGFIGLPREAVRNRYPFQPSRLIVRYIHTYIFRFALSARAMKTPAAVKENSPVLSLLLAASMIFLFPASVGTSLLKSRVRYPLRGCSFEQESCLRVI